MQSIRAIQVIRSHLEFRLTEYKEKTIQLLKDVKHWELTCEKTQTALNELQYIPTKLKFLFTGENVEFTQLCLSAYKSEWMGTSKHSILCLTNKRFRDTIAGFLRSIAKMHPQWAPLRYGDIVSSIRLSSSKMYISCMRRQLCDNSSGYGGSSLQRWTSSKVHRFRIISNPNETTLLFPNRRYNASWIVVPDLPWDELFACFGISSLMSFPTKRSRLRRILFKIRSFRINCRNAMWKFH